MEIHKKHTGRFNTSGYKVGLSVTNYSLKNLHNYLISM